MNSWIRGFFILLMVLLLAACEADTPDPEVELRVGQAQVRVTLATTPETRSRGLMYRSHLAPDQGMLLVFPKPALLRLWMRNVPIPLDAGFFDQQGRLINIVAMAVDDGKQIHQSAAPALYALEVNRGWFERHGLAAGERMLIDRLQQLEVK